MWEQVPSLGPNLYQKESSDPKMRKVAKFKSQLWFNPNIYYFLPEMEME